VLTTGSSAQRAGLDLGRPDVEASDSMWMYSYYWDTWLWSSKANFPIVYATGSEVWLYYFIVEGVGAYVFDYSTYTWTLVP
jgi:hypothetical protein